MTPDNQTLLTAIREMIAEANAPIVALLQQLDSRVERLEVRMERLEVRMEQFEVRMEQFEVRMERFEGQLETLDARTSQLLSDFHDLRERVTVFEERLDNGFRALKSDLNFGSATFAKPASRRSAATG